MDVGIYSVSVNSVLDLANMKLEYRSTEWYRGKGDGMYYLSL